MKVAVRTMATIASVLVASACAETTSPPAPRVIAPSLASSGASLIGAPDLNDPVSMEGKVWACKDGTPSGVSFDFDYSVLNTNTGNIITSGTVAVPMGSCVLAASFPTNIIPFRFLITVTEQAPPAFWTLTDLTYAYAVGRGPGQFVPVVDIPNRTISNLRINNDAGVMTVFTNTFDPPTGEVGDFVWNDLNKNGIQDFGETGLAGLTVTLSGTSSGTTTTDANGAYSFTGLTAGSYTVTVATPSGYTASPSGQGGDATKDSNGSPASVTLATNSSVDNSIDFGFHVTPPPPPSGCTYTQGYWKNHQSNWDSMADGHLYTTTTPFYNSGKTYHGILKTSASGGNAYIQLAYQFIAAGLVLNGNLSGIPAVDAAMAGAAAYYPTAPAGVPNPTGALRTQLQAWATTLDNFNNGRFAGWPHC